MTEASERLRLAVRSLRPSRSWSDVGRRADIEVWRVDGEDEWQHRDPQEDLALPPLIDWTDDLNRLALSAYREVFDDYLEQHQHYELQWPPRGELASPGAWYVEEPARCVGHPDDDQCDRERVVEAMAEWEWHVEVVTWETVTGRDGVRRLAIVQHEDSDKIDEWYLGATAMPPWEVEFGPHRDSADRVLIYLASRQPG